MLIKNESIQSKLNMMNSFLRSQKCRTCDQIYEAIKACARPGQGSTDTKLSSSIVPSYIGRRVLDLAKTERGSDHAAQARRFLACSKCCIVHLNTNFIILTFIFIYWWNKTFKILALAPNDLFKGKHICQAVIKVNPGHLSESLWCKTDLLSIWGVWAKTGASCEIVSHEERSVSAYLKYPGRPNKCHTQEKFPLLSAHLQKLAINFDHSFPLWRAWGRIIFLSTWCSRVVCSAQILFPHYPWCIDTVTPDGGDTWADGARGWDHSLWHTGHCCDCEPPTPRHCVLCHLPGLALWR